MLSSLNILFHLNFTTIELLTFSLLMNKIIAESWCSWDSNPTCFTSELVLNHSTVLSSQRCSSFSSYPKVSALWVEKEEIEGRRKWMA